MFEESGKLNFTKKLEDNLSKTKRKKISIIHNPKNDSSWINEFIKNNYGN